MSALFALTLWRPWPDAILRWPGRHAKLVENRDWWRRSLLGHHFAIHAGRRYDREGAEFIDELAQRAFLSNGGWRVPSPSESHEGIVGVARLCGIVDADPDRPERARVIAGEYPGGIGGFVWGPWWMGGIGWLLDERTAIEPVPCRGAQGLWRVPDGTADVVRARWDAARRAA